MFGVSIVDVKFKQWHSIKMFVKLDSKEVYDMMKKKREIAMIVSFDDQFGKK